MPFAGEACSSKTLQTAAALHIPAWYIILSSPHHRNIVARVSSLDVNLQAVTGDEITTLTASACYGLLWVFALQTVPFYSKHEKLLSNIAEARLLTLMRLLEAMKVSSPSLAASN